MHSHPMPVPIRAQCMCMTSLFLYIMTAMLYAESEEMSDTFRQILAVAMIVQSLIVITTCLVAVALEVAEWYLSRKAQAKLITLAKPTKPDTPNTQDIKKVIISGELKKTLEVHKLHAWAARITDSKSAERYFDLDKWMSPMVADDSPNSIYDRDPKAEMYRSLLQNCPYLIDFAAHAPTEIMNSLRRILFLLEQVHDLVGPSGLYAQHVETVDLSSVFYWVTMWASPQQRSVFADVMESIHNAQTKTRAWSPANWSAVLWKYVGTLDCSPPKVRKSYPTRVIKELLSASEETIDSCIVNREKSLIRAVQKKVMRQLRGHFASVVPAIALLKKMRQSRLTRLGTFSSESATQSNKGNAAQTGAGVTKSARANSATLKSDNVPTEQVEATKVKSTNAQKEKNGDATLILEGKIVQEENPDDVPSKETDDLQIEVHIPSTENGSTDTDTESKQQEAEGSGLVEV